MLLSVAGRFRALCAWGEELMYQVTQYFQTFSENTLRLMHSMNRQHWLILLALAFALGAYWLRGMGGRKDW
jgi:ABC-type nickel/cobalt efflux system permease component RcnA